MTLNFIIIGLFPGICFSVFYLKGIKELAKSDNIKLLSFHTFFAAIYITCFLIVALFLAWLLNATPSISSKTKLVPSELQYICMLGLYLSSFWVAYRAGSWLCKKEILYEQIKPENQWTKIFNKKNNTVEYFVTVVVETGKSTWLYVGILDYYMTNDGELEYIRLATPYRREVAIGENSHNPNKRPFKERFYKIDVDTLVIKYSDVRSLGIKEIPEKVFKSKNQAN